jgi:hypothetical protein
MNASHAALALMLAPLVAFPRVTASTLSTLTSALAAEAVLKHAPLVHLLKNN